MIKFLRGTLGSLELDKMYCGSIPLPYETLYSDTICGVLFYPHLTSSTLVNNEFCNYVIINLLSHPRSIICMPSIPCGILNE